MYNQINPKRYVINIGMGVMGSTYRNLKYSRSSK